MSCNAKDLGKECGVQQPRAEKAMVREAALGEGLARGMPGWVDEEEALKEAIEEKLLPVAGRWVKGEVL